MQDVIINQKLIEPSCPQYDIITSPQQVNLFMAGQGSGKCLGKGTVLRMFDGTTKKVEDILTGDLLMGPDSKPRKVIGLGRGREQMYWIRQNRAMDYRVNESHILRLRQSRKAKGCKEVNISVSDWFKQCKKFKESYMGYRVAVDYLQKALPIDPYFLGLWLGDGSRGTISITAIEPEIIEYINKVAGDNGMKVNKSSRSERSITHAITNGKNGGRENILLSLFRNKGLLNNKHIPFDYLTTCKEDRLKLLAGIVDTDGNYAPKKNCIEITQKSERLAEDIKELCLSLGFRTSLAKKNATLKRPGKPIYECIVSRVCIYGNIHTIPCRVKRKKPVIQSNRLNWCNTGIKVEKSTVDDYYGFTLDGDGLFLLEDFTVTHNTFVGGVVSGRLITRFPKVHGFIGANTHGQLSDSTLFRIRKVWKEDFAWTEWSKDNPTGCYVVNIQPPAHFNTEDHEYTTYRGKISFSWGTVVYMGSLANYEAHEGKEFAWAILDETKDTKEEAVKEVITGRMREQGVYLDENDELADKVTLSIDEQGNIIETKENRPFNPLYILTSPAKVKWINEWFNLDEYSKEITELIYDKEKYFLKDVDNKRVTISSVYHNQHNLPSSFIPNQLLNLHSGLQDMLIYGNPFSNTGGEFYKCFQRTKNVIDAKQLLINIAKDGEPENLHTIFWDREGNRAYCKTLALHISFDFNVNPYMTCTIWQVIGKIAVQIDEICLPNPRNTTIDVCKEFIRRYQGHAAGVFIYGDPSGRHEDTRTEKGFNDFTVIVKALVQFRPSMRIMSVAPAVVMRGNFINTVFEKGYEGVQIFIHEKCPKSIDDLVYLKEASDGTKLKEKVKNPDTNVTYEKFGHTSDSLEYFICVAFATEFNKYKAGGTASQPASSGKSIPSKNTY